MSSFYDIDEFYELIDDDLAFFALAKKAKSYGFFEEVGYFRNLTTSSSTGHFYFSNMNKKWSDMFYKLFKAMIFFDEKTRNNRIEKRWVFKFFLDKIYPYRNKLIYVDKYFLFIKDVIDYFLKCNFFTKGEKEKLLKFNDMLIDIKTRLGY